MLKVKTDYNFGIIHILLRVNPVCVPMFPKSLFTCTSLERNFLVSNFSKHFKTSWVWCQRFHACDIFLLITYSCQITWQTARDEADLKNFLFFTSKKHYTQVACMSCLFGDICYKVRSTLASPQTSFGFVRHEWGKKWMRDERTAKDVCGEARSLDRENAVTYFKSWTSTMRP